MDMLDELDRLHRQWKNSPTAMDEPRAYRELEAYLNPKLPELIRLARAGRKLEGGTVCFCDDCEGVYESPSDYITSNGLAPGETFELMECVSFSMKEYRVLDDRDYEAIDAAMSATKEPK